MLLGSFMVMLCLVQTNRLKWSTEFAQAGWQPDAPREQTISELQTAAWDRRVGFLGLAGCGVLAFLAHGGARRRTFGRRRGLAVFVGLWILASCVWADDQWLAFRRVAAFFAMCLGAAGFARCFRRREALYFLLVSSAVMVAAGLAVEVAMGAFHPADPAYRFSGTLHPNHQAWNCAGALLAAIGLWTTEDRRRPLWGVLAGAAFILLFMTRSRTSIGACVVALVAYAAMIGDVRARRLLAVALPAVVLLGLLAIAQSGDQSVLDVMLLRRVDVDNAGLSGRTDVWRVAFQAFLERPWLGYGFGAFGTPERLLDVSEEIGWVPPSMHSEYIDLLLGVGMVGTVAFLLLVGESVTATYCRFRRCRSRLVAFSCAVSAFCLTAMLLESLARDPTFLTFVFYVDLMRFGLDAGEHG